MYRESPTAVRPRKESGPTLATVMLKITSNAFLLLYFVLLPILITIAVHWAVYAFTHDNFYQESWMGPILLLFSTFLAGALMRQKMEDESSEGSGGMGLFFLGLVALFIFAALTQQDINSIGGVYSRLMPKLLRPGVSDYILMLPAVGVIGMLAYKQFTLKHYS